MVSLYSLQSNPSSCYMYMETNNYIYIKNSMLHNNLACIRGIKTKI